MATSASLSTLPRNDAEPGVRLRARWRYLLLQGIAMIVLGLLAAALPVVTTFAVAVLVGWLLLIGGVWRAIHVVRSSHAPGFGWALGIAIVAAVLGMLMLLQPLPGMLTLTMLLVTLFVLEGAGKIMLALDLRRHARAWGWPLASGITDLALAVLIMAGWPGTAAWVIGLFVGLNMAFFGIALTLVALAARRARENDLQRIALGASKGLGASG